MTLQDVDIQTEMPEVEDKENKENKRAEVTTIENRKDEKAAASASKTENKKAAASATKPKNKKASSSAKKTDLNEVAEEIELSEYEKYVAGKRKSNEEWLLLREIKMLLLQVVWPNRLMWITMQLL